MDEQEKKPWHPLSPARRAREAAKRRRSIEAIVSGRVQGVGFRAFAQNEAQLLGLAGYVQNQVDGTVLVRASGHPSNIEALVEVLSQGPRGCKVDAVAVSEVDPEEPMSRPFRIRRRERQP